MPGGDHIIRLPREDGTSHLHHPTDLEEGSHYSEDTYDKHTHTHHKQQGSTTLTPTSTTTTALLSDIEGGYNDNDNNDTHTHTLTPRVVIFTAAYYVCDGVSLTIRKLRAHLQQKGIESRVVSCGPAGWSEPDVFTVPSIPLPIINADDNFGYSLGIKLTQECKDKIKAFRPSIIHFTVPDFLALDALRWAKSENIPVLGTWHSNYSDYLKFYHLNLIRIPVERYIRSFYVNMPVYVPTPFIKNKLLESGFPEGRVGIWGRGVDLSMFNPSNRSLAFRRNKGIADDEVVILWVGRLVKEKSPDIWAECIKRLHREGLNFRALVVGTGSYEENMKKLPRTEHLGWMSGKDLAEVYASVDVFLFPSEVETFGNVTLEALASGVPCIASAGCSGHLVYHGVNGFVVEKANVEEYYKYTKRLVTDVALRQKCAEKARASISTLEHDRVMDMMVSNYEGVMKTYHQGEGRRNRGGGMSVNDMYISFVYHFFAFLLFIGTPIMKTYVAVVHFVCRLLTCSFPFPHQALRVVGRTLCCFGSSSSSGGGGGGANGSSNGGFRERMRFLACCVYLTAMLIIYHTYAAMAMAAGGGGGGGGAGGGGGDVGAGRHTD